MGCRRPGEHGQPLPVAGSTGNSKRGRGRKRRPRGLLTRPGLTLLLLVGHSNSSNETERSGGGFSTGQQQNPPPPARSPAGAGAPTSKQVFPQQPHADGSSSPARHYAAVCGGTQQCRIFGRAWLNRSCSGASAKPSSSREHRPLERRCDGKCPWCKPPVSPSTWPWCPEGRVPGLTPSPLRHSPPRPPMAS